MKQEINFSMTVPEGGYELKIQGIYRANFKLIVVIETNYSDEEAAAASIETAVSEPISIELMDVSHPLPVTYYVIDSNAPPGAWWLKSEKFTHVQSTDEIKIPEQAICIMDDAKKPIQPSSVTSQASSFFSAANRVELKKFGYRGFPLFLNRHMNLFCVKKLTKEQDSQIRGMEGVQRLPDLSRHHSIFKMMGRPFSMVEIASVCHIDPWQITNPLYTTSSSGLYVPTGGLYVIFKEEPTRAILDAIVAQHQLELSDERDERTFIFKVVNPLQDTVQIAFELQKDVTISVVEPDLATGAPQTCYTANASMS